MGCCVSNTESSHNEMILVKDDKIKECIAAFKRKTDPKSDEPRQKLSAVYDYMLSYIIPSRTNVLYFYGIPAFMDPKCGILAEINKMKMKKDTNAHFSALISKLKMKINDNNSLENYLEEKRTIF